MTLLHELAHAVYKSLSRSRYDPYYGNHVVAEIGHAWGCWAFGGAISPINPIRMEKPACIGGFWVPTPSSPYQKKSILGDWPVSRPPPPNLGDLTKDETFWILAMEYIQCLQAEEFWENEIKAHGVRALHVLVPPTTGNHDSQLSLNTNWKASVSMTRGPNGNMVVDVWSSKMVQNPEWLEKITVIEERASVSSSLKSNK